MFVSNVVAATDLTLMALAGIGLRRNKVKENSMDNVKVFSFWSVCPHWLLIYIMIMSMLHLRILVLWIL